MLALITTLHVETDYSIKTFQSLASFCSQNTVLARLSIIIISDVSFQISIDYFNKAIIFLTNSNN